MKIKSIFINGDFLTFDKKTDHCQALAVEDGIITDIGSNLEIKPLTRRGYSVYDLKKKLAVPAITDAHLHVLSVGNLFKRVDLDGVDSLEKVAALLKKYSSGLKPGQWLRGRGWNKNLWGGEFPDKSLLDKITENPVALGSKDGHLLWANSAALDFCGIDRDTPNPPGGVIAKDDKGEPDGILKENAVELVYSRIPRQTAEEETESLLAAQKHLLKLGVIGVGECETRHSLLSRYRELDGVGKLRLRVFRLLHPDDLDKYGESGLKTGVGSDHLRIGCLKLFADGALGSQTAYMFEPYEGSNDNYGVETLTTAAMEHYIARAADIGISVAIHAIGDKANCQALTALGNYADRFAAKKLLPRIEHAQLLRESEISMFKKRGIIASMQPIHATSDRDISDRYWGARARFAYPFKTLLRSGAVLAFGSDAPIETPNPLAGIHAAVTRERTGETRKSWYPEEKLTILEALRIYTRGSAEACCFDDISGSIRLGMRADFVVLSGNILKIKPDEIADTAVAATVVDGKAVYGNKQLSS